MTSLTNRFIAFEGGEGTGKSTQIHSLKAFLEQQSFEVVLTWEPGGTELGGHVRKLLLEPSSDPMSAKCEALLYAATRAEHVDKVIAPALKRGAFVLCDRYWDASRAYQGFARRLGIAAIDRINHWATEGLFPERVFLFDLDPAKGLERALVRGEGKLDRIESEGNEFHRRIREAYLQITKRDPERYHVIDASLSIEAIRNIIEKDMTQHFGLKK